MEWWKQTLIVVATCSAMFAIVPLMVWGGTGNWRRALQALKQYLMVLGGLALVGGGIGLLMSLATWMG